MSKTTDLAAADVPDVPPDPALVRARVGGPLGSLAGVPLSIGMCVPYALHFFSLESDRVVSRVAYVLMAALFAVSPLLRRYERKYVGAWKPRLDGAFIIGAVVLFVLALPFLMMGVFIYGVPAPGSWFLEIIAPIFIVAVALLPLWHRAWHAGRRGWWHTALALASTAGIALAWTALPAFSARMEATIMLTLLCVAVQEVLNHLELRGVLGR